MNMLVTIARGEGRNYITPEDITDAMAGHGLDIDLDFLEILGKQIPNMGIEDAGLCAFNLWEKLKDRP